MVQKIEIYGECFIIGVSYDILQVLHIAMHDFHSCFLELYLSMNRYLSMTGNISACHNSEQKKDSISSRHRDDILANGRSQDGVNCPTINQTVIR